MSSNTKKTRSPVSTWGRGKGTSRMKRGLKRLGAGIAALVAALAGAVALLKSRNDIADVPPENAVHIAADLAKNTNFMMEEVVGEVLKRTKEQEERVKQYDQ